MTLTPAPVLLAALLAAISIPGTKNDGDKLFPAEFNQVTAALGSHEARLGALEAGGSAPRSWSRISLLTVAATPASTYSGGPLELTATVRAIDGSIPTDALVVFYDGATGLGVSYSVHGVASLNITTTGWAAGNHLIWAVYPGSGSDCSPAFAAPVAVTIDARTPTSLDWIPSVNPVSYRSSVTLTATVTPSGATGTVTFMDGATSLGTSTLSGGTASLTLSSIAAGDHWITANYSGSSTYSPSASSARELIIIGGTSTTLVSTRNPSGSEVTVSFTANVTSASSTPTGSVTLLDAGASIGTSALNGGAAYFSISSLQIGSHPLVARYSGATGFSASDSTTLVQVVQIATPTFTVSISGGSPRTVATGQTLPLIAYVSKGTAGIVVTFKDGTTTLGTATTVAGGYATFTLSGLARGGHSVTATATVTGVTVTSAAVTVNVLQGAGVAVATAPNPSAAGQTVAITVSVAPVTTTPSGSVTVFDAGTTLGTANLTAGAATITTAALGNGPHSIYATYSGDATYVADTSPTATHVVQTASTTVSLVSSSNPANVGAPVTLTAVLTPSSAPGSITFRDGSTTLGTGSITSGVATFTTSSLSAGTHSITASYGGDLGYVAAVSAAVSQVVVNGSVFTPTAIALPTDVPNPGRGMFSVNTESTHFTEVTPVDLYTTLPWRWVETAAGTYDWSYIDARLATATARGGRLGVRIFSLNTSGGWANIGSHNGGLWFLPDDMKATTNPLLATHNSVVYAIPDWNDADYLARVTAFINAFAARYSSNPHMGWFEVMGYGNWGEWHMGPFIDDNPSMYPGAGGQTDITQANVHAIMNAHMAAFSSTDIIPVALVDPNTDGGTYAVNNSGAFGLRSDSIGRVKGSWTLSGVGAPGELFATSTTAANRWHSKPFFGEMVAASLNDQNKWSSIEAATRTYHISAISDDYEAAGITGTDAANMHLAYAEAGYRIRVSSATITPTLTGCDWSVTFVNDGTAPAHWGGEAYIGIYGPGAAVNAAATGVSVATFMPGVPVTLTGSTTDTYTAGQSYDVDVFVVHPNEWTWRMNLAQEGINTAHGAGHYRLGTVTNLSTGASTVTSVSITSPPASVNTGTQTTFAASVAGTGSPSQAVTWSSTAGTWAGNVWTAPSTAQSVTITARSDQDNTKAGTATVVVQAQAPASVALGTPCTRSAAAPGATFSTTCSSTGAGILVAVLAHANDWGTPWDPPGTPCTISGGGLTWTLQERQVEATTGYATYGVRIWTAPMVAALASSVITVSCPNSVSAVQASLGIYPVLGNAAVGAHTGLVQAASAQVSTALTATKAGSIVIWGGATDRSTSVLPALSGTVLDASGADVNGSAAVGHLLSPTSAAGQVTVGSSFTTLDVATAAIEIAPSGGGGGGSATVTSVAVAPATASVSGGAQATFGATVNCSVQGGCSTSVSWSTSDGSISQAGVFTAPTTQSSARSVTVTATAAGGVTGTATVTVPGNGGGGTNTTITTQLASMATHTMFFDHASVGENLSDGLFAIADGYTGAKPTRVNMDTANGGYRLGSLAGGFYETTHLAVINGNPTQKMTDFASHLATVAGSGSRVDVAFMKFCWTDFNGSSDTAAIFAAYQSMIATAQATYPSIRFLHITPPLDNADASGNAKRYDFGRRMVTAYGSGVWDLQYWESNGWANTLGGAPALVNSYTSDSGHLNATGQAAIVPKMIEFLGNIGQSIAAAPTISPNSGTYPTAQTVTLATSTSGATIRYTTTGTAPSCSPATGTVYSAPFSVSSTATVKAIACATGYTPSSVSSATYTIGTIVSSPKMGVNLEGISFFTRNDAFNNMMTQAGTDGSGPVWKTDVNSGSGVAMDANGWPTGSAGATRLREYWSLSNSAYGSTYRVSFKAKVTGATGSVTNCTTGTRTETASGDGTYPYLVSFPCTYSSGDMTFAYSGAAGGIKDVKVLHPGSQDSDLLAPHFKAAISHFSAIRFYQAQGWEGYGVNTNGEKFWSERRRPTYSTWNGDIPDTPVQNGLPYEAMILMANDVGADVWVNVPYLTVLDTGLSGEGRGSGGASTTDYLTRMSQVFRCGSNGSEPWVASPGTPGSACTGGAPTYPPLAAGKHVYIEFGNEIWNNYSYPYTRDIAWIETSGHRLYGGSGVAARYPRVADALVMVSNAWRADWGGAAMNATVRVVASGWVGDSNGYSSGVLSALQAKGAAASPTRTVASYVYGIAGAPYLQSNSGSAANIVSAMHAEVIDTSGDTVGGALVRDAALANQYQIKMVSYEGGIGNVGASVGTCASIRLLDTQRTQVLQPYFQRWFNDSTADVFMYYSLSRADDGMGCFGLMQTIDDQGSSNYRWQGVLNSISGNF